MMSAATVWDLSGCCDERQHLVMQQQVRRESALHDFIVPSLTVAACLLLCVQGRVFSLLRHVLAYWRVCAGEQQAGAAALELEV
jgi:hypothetical protein